MAKRRQSSGAVKARAAWEALDKDRTVQQNAAWHHLRRQLNRFNRAAHLHADTPVPTQHTIAPDSRCLFGERVPRSASFAEAKTSMSELAALDTPSRMSEGLGFRLNKPMFE